VVRRGRESHSRAKATYTIPDTCRTTREPITERHARPAATRCRAQPRPPQAAELDSHGHEEVHGEQVVVHGDDLGAVAGPDHSGGGDGCV